MGDINNINKEHDIEIDKNGIPIVSSYIPGDIDEWKNVRAFWRDYLNEFEKELYYPIFAKYGYSKNSALLIYCVKGVQVKVRDSNSKQNEEDE